MVSTISQEFSWSQIGRFRRGCYEICYEVSFAVFGCAQAIDPLVPNYQGQNSKCFIWCRLGNQRIILSLSQLYRSCTELFSSGGFPESHRSIPQRELRTCTPEGI